MNSQLGIKQKGLTLVELMMAIILSLMLGAGAYTMYEGTKSASKTQGDLARVQEGGRYGINRLINAVSSAGYMGCNQSTYKANSTITNTVTVNTTTGAGWVPNLRNPVSGEDGVSGAPDTLTLAWARAEFPVTVTGHTSQTAPVIVNGTTEQYKKMVERTGLTRGDIVAVSDCEAIAVFMLENNVPTSTFGVVSLTHAGGTSVNGVSNASAGIEHTFPAGRSYVHKLEALQFSLATKTVNGRTVSSLYAREIGQAAPGDEIIEGVEDFQVQYGEDLAPFDGSADRYLDWSSAVESQRVSSLRITLRVNSGSPMANADGEAGSNDLVKDIVFTVKLRNRGATL